MLKQKEDSSVDHSTSRPSEWDAVLDYERLLNDTKHVLKNTTFLSKLVENKGIFCLDKEKILREERERKAAEIKCIYDNKKCCFCKEKILDTGYARIYGKQFKPSYGSIYMDSEFLLVQNKDHIDGFICDPCITKKFLARELITSDVPVNKMVCYYCGSTDDISYYRLNGNVHNVKGSITGKWVGAHKFGHSKWYIYWCNGCHTKSIHALVVKDIKGPVPDNLEEIISTCTNEKKVKIYRQYEKTIYLKMKLNQEISRSIM